MGTLHAWLIALHAVTATLAVVAGAALLRPRPVRSPWPRLLYLPSLVVMTAALAAAVVVGWPGSTAGERVAFPVLTALAAVVVAAGRRADVAARRRSPGEVDRLYDAGGFTMISLFDGFVIVAAIDLGAPGWAVAAVAVLGVLAGRRLVHAARARATAHAAPIAPAAHAASPRGAPTPAGGAR